ncbi:hypothetical protein [Zunongwangia sp. H14]|uniref:hypothetical protein n=1 Tax=Zunongwangia sp. H14 TaxID=3240792 RepID=UPI003565C129
MKNILNILGLKTSLKLKLDSERIEFIKFMEEDIKPDQLIFFDIFDGNEKKYYGNIDQNGFKLRRNTRSLFPESQFTRAIGKISGGNNYTELDISIIGWNWFVIIFLIFMGLIFGLSLNDIISTKSYGVLIMLIPVFLFFLLVLIFNMRKGVRRFEKFLKAELIKVDR